MTTEKCYLLGKFARVCSEDAVHRLQRPALHGAAPGPATRRRSASTGPATRWSDIPLGRGHLDRRRQRRRVRPDHHQLRLAGPRARAPGSSSSTPASRRSPGPCDLFLPVKPGRDAALFAGVLHLMIENDWLDHDFIDDHTVGLRAGAPKRASEWTPPDGGRGDRDRREGDPPGGRVVGTGEDQLPDARPRHGAAQPRGGTTCLGGDQHRPRLGPDRPAGVRLLDHHRPGQRPGRPRARPEVRPAPRRPRHREPRAPPVHRRRLGHPRARAAARRRRLLRALPQDRRRRDQGPARICFNPVVSLPDSTSSSGCWRSSSSSSASTSSSARRPASPTWCCPAQLHEEDEGTSAQAEGRVIKINQAVTPPGEARQDWQILQDIAHALGRERGFTFQSPREIFEELRQSQRAAWPTTRASPTRRSSEAWASSGRARRGPGTATDGPPRDAAAVRAGVVEPGGEGGRAVLLPGRQGPFHAPRYEPPTEDVDADYPVILTTGRVVSLFLSGNQTRRIGPLVDQYPEPRLELHPSLATKLGIADGDWVTVETRRGSTDAPGPGGDHDPARHGVRPLPLGRGRRASTC